MTFADGGTASGSFTYDATTNTYADIAITTSAGILPGAGYGVVDAPPSIVSSSAVSFIDSASDGALPNRIGASRLLLTFATPLTDAGGTVSLALLGGASEGICQTSSCLPPPSGSNLRLITGGSVMATPVPLPAAAWLFAGSLGALGWVRREPAMA